MNGLAGLAAPKEQEEAGEAALKEHFDTHQAAVLAMQAEAKT